MEISPDSSPPTMKSFTPAPIAVSNTPSPSPSAPSIRHSTQPHSPMEDSTPYFKPQSPTPPLPKISQASIITAAIRNANLKRPVYLTPSPSPNSSPRTTQPLSPMEDRSPNPSPSSIHHRTQPLSPMEDHTASPNSSPPSIRHTTKLPSSTFRGAGTSYSDPTFKRKTHCFENFDLSLPVPFPVYITRKEPRVEFHLPKVNYVPPELRPILPPVPLMRRLQYLESMSFYWKGKAVKFSDLLPADTKTVYTTVMDKRVTCFTVNNGPRRSLDLVPNLVFLDAITNSICPIELEPKDKNVVCHFIYMKSRS